MNSQETPLRENQIEPEIRWIRRRFSIPAVIANAFSRITVKKKPRPQRTPQPTPQDHDQALIRCQRLMHFLMAWQTRMFR